MIKSPLVLPYNGDLEQRSKPNVPRGNTASLLYNYSPLRHTQHHFAEVLCAVDIAVSRSRLFGQAARSYLDRRRRQRDVDQYLASYRELPESEEEVTATDAFLRRSFAGEP